METNESVKKLEGIQKEVNEALDMNIAEDLIKNNEIVFEEKNTTYKIRRPTTQERQELNKLRIKKYIEYLNKDEYPLESELRKMYKKRGIDIDELDKQLVQIEEKKKNLYLQLGQALKDNESDDICKNYKDEILKLQEDQTELSVKKTSYLQYSLETQVMADIYTYLAWLVSEKKVGESWEKVYTNFEDLQTAQSFLANKIVLWASLLMRNELET